MTAIASLLDFWRAAGAAGHWFSHDPHFDRQFREMFLDRHMAVAARLHDDWMETAEGALALLILTDQFPRNAFRGTGHMYATDPLARSFARAALAAGHMAQVEEGLRVFFCLPFAHAEDLVDQELSVALNLQLGEPWLAHAIDHRDIVLRFGRFPHRNPLLGRETTAEEARFLAEGGFAG
ncbi:MULTISPECIES: DUF924 family protein [unclassified Xanthobacter]|uniref:DUF924 family protein n=1 Tax=unclassified Xanthobacter TaxID=2623496 RepID=UPI001EDCB5D6|nr:MULTISPECIES: DUF924 family protein [unclassified Xanthobacter]